MGTETKGKEQEGYYPIFYFCLGFVDDTMLKMLYTCGVSYCA